MTALYSVRQPSIGTIGSSLIRILYPASCNFRAAFSRAVGPGAFRSHFFATFPALILKLSGGTTAGRLPPQRRFVPDSRASGYAPFGVLRGAYIKELAGNRYAMLNAEHNFRNVPFLWLNIPFLYRNGIELIMHGSAAQTWDGNVSTSGGWYSDIGAGISRILDIFRFDVTYRIKKPAGLYFSLGTAGF